MNKAFAGVASCAHIEMCKDGPLWHFLTVETNPTEEPHRLLGFEYKSFRFLSGTEGYRVGAGGDIAGLSVVRGR